MNPRRYSQIERALQILDKSGTIDILKDDQYLLFLFKKTERIVAALYVITGLFPDVEPLKWSLRESSAHLLKHTLSFKERATVHSKEFLSDTFAELAHLISLVDLAHIADLLSPMNFSILKKEFDILQTSIEGKWKVQGTAFLPEGFFGVSRELFPEIDNHQGAVGTAQLLAEGGTTVGSFSELERLKRNIKDTQDKGQDDARGNVFNTKSGGHTKSAAPVLRRKVVLNAVPDHTKEERKQRIIGVLRTQKSAMIKDFSSVITGCSEKTIQRLLMEMVQTGVLKREGDRRWSRYSLVSERRELLA